MDLLLTVTFGGGEGVLILINAISVRHLEDVKKNMGDGVFCLFVCLFLNSLHSLVHAGLKHIAILLSPTPNYQCCR